MSGKVFFRFVAPLLLAVGVSGLVRAEGQIDAEAFFAARMTATDEQVLALESFRGRPLVVNFWARWCGPCRDEIPELIKLRAAQVADGIEVVGIAIEELDKLPAVRDFAQAYEMDYPVVVAAKDGVPLMKALGNEQAGMPYTVYIGRDGRAVGSKLGVLSAADLAAAAALLLD